MMNVDQTVMDKSRYWLIQDISYRHYWSGQPDDGLVSIIQQSRLLEVIKKYADTVHQVDWDYR